jgi:hypothetical protein
MDAGRLFDRYRELQSYVGWTDDDARRIAGRRPDAGAPPPRPHRRLLRPRSNATRGPQVITGGPPQIERLKGTLLRWVRELLAGRYDEAYVDAAGGSAGRHVEIGLDQVYTNVALSRLRTGLVRALQEGWEATPRGSGRRSAR